MLGRRNKHISEEQILKMFLGCMRKVWLCFVVAQRHEVLGFGACCILVAAPIRKVDIISRVEENIVGRSRGLQNQTQTRSMMLEEAVQAGNGELLHFLLKERKGDMDQQTQIRLVQMASQNFYPIILQILVDEYNFPSDAIDVNALVHDVFINRNFNNVFFLYQHPNAARNTTYNNHLYFLQKAIENQKAELVALILPFILPELLQKQKKSDYIELIRSAAKRSNTDIIHSLLRDYHPLDFNIVYTALYAAETPRMVDYLLQYSTPSGRIKLSDKQILDIVTKALRQNQQSVAEYFFSPQVLNDFLLDRPDLVDAIASAAPEYRGKQVHLHKKAYLFKQVGSALPLQDEDHSIRFFYIGRDLYAFSRRHVWRIQLKDKLSRKAAVTPLGFQAFFNPIVKKYWSGSQIHSIDEDEDEDEDEDMDDEDGDPIDGTCLYQTLQILTSQVFGSDIVLLDVVGIGMRHMACLLASTRTNKARVVLIPLLSSSNMPELLRMQTIHELPAGVSLELATLVCVGEWLAFSNNPDILALPMTRNGRRVYKRVEFNPFAVVDLAPTRPEMNEPTFPLCWKIWTGTLTVIPNWSLRRRISKTF